MYEDVKYQICDRAVVKMDSTIGLKLEFKENVEKY